MITVKNIIIPRNYVNFKKIDTVVSVFLIYFPEQNYIQKYLCDKSTQDTALFPSLNFKHNLDLEDFISITLLYKPNISYNFDTKGKL